MENFLIKTSFFLLGILAVQFLTELPSYGFLVTALVCLLITYKKAASLSCFIFGFIWAALYAIIVLNQQLPKPLEAVPVLLQGTIVNLPDKQQDATRFIFNVSKLVHVANTQVKNQSELNKSQLEKLQLGTIRLSWYRGAPNIKAGEQWQLLVKLKRPHGSANPYGFDFEKWLFQQHINATGYVRESDHNVRLKQAAFWQISHWRESLRSYLNASLHDSENLGIIKALVLGDRSGISTEQWAVFRATGTSHLIAISGLHIGLVTALVFSFVKWFALFFNSIRFVPINVSPIRSAIISGLIAAICYAALAGFSIPTQRALLMVSVVMGAMYWQRHYTASRVICVALWLVLLFDPLAVLSAGFWLSFSAVAIISYGLVGRLKQPSFIYQLVKTQFLVALGLLPFVVYFFQQVSLIAPLANILAVPFVSLLLIPVLLFSLLISIASTDIGAFSLNLADGLMGVLGWFLGALSDFEYAQWALPSVPLWAACFAMLAVLVLFMPNANAFKLFSLFLFLPLLFPMHGSTLNDAEFDVVMLDVGQGLSVVVRTKQHSLVFDTGAKYSDRSDMASSVVIPYLKGKGIDQVDRLIISHGDNDHAGGVAALLREIEVEELLSSVPEIFAPYANSVKLSECVSGESWQWDGVDFEFLHPSSYKIFTGNNASCVLKVTSKNGSALLTGDIEKNAEQSLLRYSAKKLQSDVLIAPHHGSRTSSIMAFIKAVSPKYVLYPVGYLNRYGFPKVDVVSRYKTLNIHQFDSASSGALITTFRLNRLIQVQPYRQMSAKYWNWVE